MDPLYKCIAGTFELPENFQLCDSLGPGLVPGWDSLGGIKLMNTVEEEFQVALTLEQAAELTTIGELRRILRELGVEV